MNKMFRFGLLAIIPAFLFSCTPKEETKGESVDLEKVKTEIQAMEDAYAAAEKAKDADGVVKYYSDDAISYHRNEAESKGKEAIKAYHVKQFAEDTTGTHNVYKVVDLFAEGDMLVEVGSWSQETPEGGQKDKGFYMSYFQKKDGKYACVRDISISTNPK